MRQKRGGWVYIVCNIHHTTLYVGVTSDIAGRIAKHKQKFYPKSFSARYNLCKLVYYQWFDTIMEAITEEKRLKAGSRHQKEKLISNMNPHWNDLYEQVKFL